jgi:hypothetical protein
MLVFPELAASSWLVLHPQLDIRLIMCVFVSAGECSTLEQQLADAQAFEAGLTKAKAALETKLAELEDLLAATTTSRDELTGGHCNLQVACT